MSDQPGGDAESRPGGQGPSADEVRARRLARVQDRLGSSPGHGSEHGAAQRSPARSGAALRHRLGATDRGGRFRHRLVAVQADVRRRRRRARTLRGAATGFAVLVAVGLGVAVGRRTGNAAVGTAVAAGLVALFVAGRRVVAGLAAARGPDAWDWQAGRHRLMGRPARRVQELDHPVAGSRDRRR